MSIIKKSIISLIIVAVSIIVMPNIVPEFQGIYIVEAATVKLNKTKLTLNVGESYTLKIKGTNKKVKWSTSNKKIATVSSKGKVKIKKNGKVTITAKVNGKKYKCKITAENPKLAATKLTLNVGERYTLKAKNTTQKVKWSTSNKKIATVSSKGKVTTKKAGKVTITAKVGSTKYKCTINVEEPKISNSYLLMNVGENYTLKMSGTTQKVTWSTSNSKVARVDSNGKVTAIGEGYVTIVVKVGSKEYECGIDIENPFLSKTNIQAKVGEDIYLEVSNTTQSVKWSTSNASIIAVNQYGDVTTLKEGSAVITAQVGNTKLNCNIVVSKPYLENKTIKLGEECQLELENVGYYYDTTWSSSNKSIVRVNNYGEISALSSGTAIITAKILNGTYTCKVTVENAYLNNTSKTLYIGEGYYLKLNNITDDDIDVTWLSSAPSIVSVDTDGEIHANRVGTAIITAKVLNQSYTCKVNVKSYTDSISISYEKTDTSVIAILKNNNDVAISIEPTMVFYNPEGSIQSTESNYNYCFEPNSIIALKFDSYDKDNYEFQEYYSYKLNIANVEKSLYSKYDSKNIKVTTTSESDKLIATVKNESNYNFSSIQICAIFYDEQGNCIGYDERSPECYNSGTIDYVNLYYPQDEEFEYITPSNYKIYVNYAY